MQDIYVPEHGVTIPGEVGTEMVARESNAFVDGNKGSYEQTFQGAREAGLKGSEKAYLVPGARLILNITLDMLAHPTVSHQLPLEVHDRSLVARQVSGEVVTQVITTGIIGLGYQNSNLLDIFDPRKREFLYSEKFMTDIGVATLRDASRIGGGALKKLEESAEQGATTDDATQVIQRSSGLLVVSRLKDSRLATFYNRLGNPYVHSEHLVVSDDGKVRKVRFLPSVPELHQAYFASHEGCPTGRIKASPSPDVPGTVLQEDWRKMAAYLAPVGATVEQYTELHPVG